MHFWSFWVVLSRTHGSERRCDLEASFGLALGVRLVHKCPRRFADCIRVVELSVGVMCSSLPAFAGFLRYYLPFLRSVRSRLGSSFRSFRLSRFLKRSIHRAGTDNLLSRKMKISLGSQVDGGGHFLNLTSIFGLGTDRSTVSRMGADMLQGHENIHATRRDFYEGSGSRRQPLNQYSLSSHSGSHGTDTIAALPDAASQCQYGDQVLSSTTHSYTGETNQRSWWKLRWRSPAPTGYWDVMSIFRSKEPNNDDKDRESQSEHTRASIR